MALVRMLARQGSWGLVAALAMAFRLIGSTQDRRRPVKAPHLAAGAVVAFLNCGCGHPRP
ncbi:hypothetical protein GCM10009839_33030 [Catenulispora yoronensis]|uniref:Uncharacterized protein n=1 Tax=Catenulispora yoronensis TaxID=450799 RepID=A0ABP5FNF5_9ACTN